MNLRELVEYEGGGQPLSGLLDPEGPTVLRLACVTEVRQCYRRARALMRSAAEGEPARGRSLMEEFAGKMAGLARQAEEEGDTPLALLAMHNQASALGLLGHTDEQNLLNRVVFGRIAELPGEADQELQFVFDKALFGLIENDPALLGEVGLNYWVAAVSRAETQRFPDFPGRALRLARYLDNAVGDLDGAEDLLERALRSEFGKADQIQDVRDYLASRPLHRQEA